MMKRIMALLLVLLFLCLTPAAARAQAIAPAFESGVGRGNNYQEVIYITGRPVVLTGTLEVREGRPRGDRVDNRYTFKLENKQEGIRLNRTLTLTTTWRQEGRQILRETTVSRFRETVLAGGDRYQVNDSGYQFSFSSITDSHPGVDYFSGNWFGRKVYEKNRGEGKVVVTQSGETVGHASPWGEVENRKVVITIEGELIREEGEAPLPWLGTVREEGSFTRKQEMTYVANEPTAISFSGGYLVTTTGEDILAYEYDLPNWTEDGEPVGRNRGSRVLYATIPLGQERLPVPAFRDIRGHWAQEQVEQMASLGILEPTGLYFAPGLPMLRGEFARALARAGGLEIQTEEEQLFPDVPPEHPYAPYINALAREGIVEGSRYNQFQPQEAVTRAQAAVMAVKLLGLERLAPVPPYSLPYLDDQQIPLWARDAIYVAGEIGFLEPDSFGRIRPQATMTRGEAAAFFERLVTFLREGMVREYQERLLNYS